LPVFEEFEFGVVELLAAVRGDVAFFIEKGVPLGKRDYMGQMRMKG
jgi:hypothetical protein